MSKPAIKTLATVAALSGLLTIFAGTRALTGTFDPGYATFPALIIYNLALGAAAIVAGVLIWKIHRAGLLTSVAITASHIIVLMLLLMFFQEIIAAQSITAMTFRVVLWLVISFLLFKYASPRKTRRNNANT